MQIIQSNPSHSRTSSVASVHLFTRGFFRTHLWVWPLVAALVLGIIGVWLRVKMENATKQQIADILQTILNANNEALHSWSITMKADAENLAEDYRVRQLVEGLIPQAKSSTQVQAALLTAPQLSVLRTHLKPMLERRGLIVFVVLNTNFLVMASGHDSLVGVQSPAGYREQFVPCLTGKVVVTRPFPSVALLPDAQGHLRVGVPTMFAVAPIRSAGGQIVALLGLRIAPDTDFTRIAAVQDGARGHYGIRRRRTLETVPLQHSPAVPAIVSDPNCLSTFLPIPNRQFWWCATSNAC